MSAKITGSVSPDWHAPTIGGGGSRWLRRDGKQAAGQSEDGGNHEHGGFEALTNRLAADL